MQRYYWFLGSTEILSLGPTPGINPTRFWGLSAPVLPNNLTHLSGQYHPAVGSFPGRPSLRFPKHAAPGTRKLERPAMLRFLPLVLKNCWRNRRRTLLTIASISVSMCLLGVMIAMYHALYLSDATPEEALRVVTRNKISLTQQMPESYKNRIKQIPGVREVMVSLIPQRHRQTGAPLQRAGEFAQPRRLAAFVAAHVDGVAHQERAGLAIARQPLERIQIGALVGAVEVGKALRGDAQRIADGEADAPLAEIERQNAGMRFGQFHYIIDACACHTRARVLHSRQKVRFAPWR